MSQLDGHVALITGAGGGIARATAALFGSEGANIVVAELDESAAAATAEVVRANGARAEIVITDVTRKSEVEAAVAKGQKTFGKVDILVNAVGIGGTSTVLEHSEDLWDRILAVNLKSAFLCSQAVLPSMREIGWGRIVNLTSRAAYKSSSGTAAYSASKGGLLAFSRVLATEVGEFGVTVNNVAPGTTVTPMVENYYGGLEAQAQEAIDSGVVVQPQRLARPDEIARALLYLCGPASDHITGTTIHVNGGSYMP